LMVVLIGVCMVSLLAPWLSNIHDFLREIDPLWPPMVLVFLCIAILSPIVRSLGIFHKNTDPQLRFLSDEEVKQTEEDILRTSEKARQFAETVLSSGVQKGL